MSSEWYDSVKRVLTGVLSPDPCVQSETTAALSSLAAPDCFVQGASTLVEILANPSEAISLRQSAALSLKYVINEHRKLAGIGSGSGSSCLGCASPYLAQLLPLVESRLLITAGECSHDEGGATASVLQRTVASLVTLLMKTVGPSSGWPTLLPTIFSAVTAGIGQNNLTYLRGALICLQCLFEDCSEWMLAACVSQLDTVPQMCDVLVRCHQISWQSGNVALAVQCLRTVEAALVQGVFPSGADYPWCGEISSSWDNDDDGDGMDGRHSGSRSQSRSFRSMVNRCVVPVVDASADLIRALLPTVVTAFDAEHSGRGSSSLSPSSSTAVLMACVAAMCQLIGYWDRVARLMDDALPALLSIVISKCQSATIVKPSGSVSMPDESDGLIVAILDLVADIAQQQHQGVASLMTKHTAVVVQALLTASVLRHPEETSAVVGDEVDYDQPDDPKTVLVTLTSQHRHRQGEVPQSSPASISTADGGGQGDINDRREAFDGDDDDDDFAADGVRRESVAWCWSTLATVYPEQVVDSLFPVLVSAAQGAMENQQRMIYEAILFTLSEVVDELYANLPAHAMETFLQQCVELTGGARHFGRRGDGDVLPDPLRQLAIVRRQAVRCLERGFVGWATSTQVSDDDDDDDGLSQPHGNPSSLFDFLRVLSFDGLLQILISSATTDVNKAVQLASLRALSNVIAHAPSSSLLLGQPSDGRVGEMTKRNNNNSDQQQMLYLQRLHELCSADVPRRLQLRGRLAWCGVLSTLADVDSSSSSNPSHSVLREMLPTLLNTLVGQCTALVAAAAAASSGTGSTSFYSSSSDLALCGELLVLCNCLCDVVEAAREALLPLLVPLWEFSICTASAFSHVTDSSAGGGIRSVYADDIVTLCLDLASAGADAVSFHSDTQSRGEMLRAAFATSSLAEFSLSILLGSSRPLQQLSSTRPPPPTLCRACFAVLVDFVSSCGPNCTPPERFCFLDDIAWVCARELTDFANGNLQPAELNPNRSDRATPASSVTEATSNAALCLATLLQSVVLPAANVNGTSEESAAGAFLLSNFPKFSSVVPQVFASLHAVMKASSASLLLISARTNLGLLAAILARLLPTALLESNARTIPLPLVSELLHIAASQTSSTGAAAAAEESLQMLANIGHFLLSVVWYANQDWKEALMETVFVAQDNLVCLAKIMAYMGNASVHDGSEKPSYHADALSVWQHIGQGLTQYQAPAQGSTRWSATVATLSKREQTAVRKVLSGR